MDVADVDLLCTVEARGLLAQLPSYESSHALAIGERLRARGHSPELVAAVLSQSRLRTNARPRWGDVVDEMILTPDGAEQATRPLVAQHRARRYRSSHVHQALDLAAGLGMDTMALASLGIRTVAVEQDRGTAAAASVNIQAAGLQALASVVTADATTLDQRRICQDADGVFADPSRRRGGRRISAPEGWSPPLSWVLGLAVGALGVKIAPGLAHEDVPSDMEFEVVSVAGDVVEGGLYRGPLRTQGVRRRATLLSNGHPQGFTLTDRDLPSEGVSVGNVGRFLHEPDRAVVRAGLVGAVAAAVDGRLLDPSIAYVTTDAKRASPYSKGYEVLGAMPFSLKRLRAALRERQVGRVTIKKRGSAVEPETLRRQLKLDRTQGGELTIFLTRVRDEPLVLLGRPLI